jgi:hypothetical protein
VKKPVPSLVEQRRMKRLTDALRAEIRRQDRLAKRGLPIARRQGRAVQ